MERIRITARRDGFRRCGAAHRRDGTDHAPDAFTDEEWERLRAEPMLTVETVDVADPTPEPPPPTEGGGKGAKEPPPPNDGGGVYGLVHCGDRPDGTVRPADDGAFMADLVGAIALLPPGSPDHFTGAGKGSPAVEAIEALVKYNLNAAERDAAWVEFQKP